MIDLPHLYGILALSRIGLQVGTASIERSKSVVTCLRPKASLIIAVYDEPLQLFYKAALSFKVIDYPDLEIIVVDDGSRNNASIKRICKELGFIYIYQKNAGKREAMYTGIQHIDPSSEVILFADSDTIWHKDAATHLVHKLLQDPTTGAVTGEVAVLNHDQNFITRLIAIRYHIAFLHERASQSFFGTVTCVSGPLGAYRRNVIDAIKQDFITQRFIGKPCTYGDDRHLTNLVLNLGYKVLYAPQAYCETNAPAQFKQLVKQQTRWSKSYWREILWQLRVLPKHGIYMWYDWTISAILPFLLVFSVTHYLHDFSTGNVWALAALLITIVGMSVVRIIEPLIRTRKPVFLLFTFYAFIYFAVMLPSKFWALATLNDGKWGTR